jgi:hypothetical protein
MRALPPSRPTDGTPRVLQAAARVLACFACCHCSFSGYDTLIAPYTRLQLSWSPVQCSYWFAVGAVGSLVVSLLSKQLSGKGVSDTAVLIALQVMVVSVSDVFSMSPSLEMHPTLGSCVYPLGWSSLAAKWPLSPLDSNHIAGGGPLWS